MDPILVGIDGASRKNGKPDGASAGGVFITVPSINYYNVLSSYEFNSTNQRGELLALIQALDFIAQEDREALIITDSEYIFNAVTKNWAENWHSKGWITKFDEPVKNQDMWLQIMQLLRRCGDNVLMYHIKGHVIPFGIITAKKLLTLDSSGETLFKAVDKKYKEVISSKQANVNKALELSIKNNGFALSEDLLHQFVVMNTVADLVATMVVDKAMESVLACD